MIESVSLVSLDTRKMEKSETICFAHVYLNCWKHRAITLQVAWKLIFFSK